MHRDSQKKRAKRIVVIGGGTGVFSVLSGLKRSGHHLSAIVTMADDGGSTGVLREEFGILPPGDIRRALVALSHAESRMAELFNYRFKEGKGIAGHSLGNLLLTALERITGSFEEAIVEAGRILRIEGEVIPVTLDHIRLRAVLQDGRVITGEHAIDVPKRARGRIKNVVLVPRPEPNRKALAAIEEAHLIVLGPGDLFTSLLPNLAVPGVAEAIRRSRAKKAYVVNVMTKYGETDGFTAQDFVLAVEDAIGKGVLDILVVNTKKPNSLRTAAYFRKTRSKPVIWSRAMFRHEPFRVVAGPFLRREGEFIRHDPARLASILVRLL